MRAILCKAWGAPRDLTFEEVPSPAPPGPGQVKIAVTAAGINFADTLMIAGHYQHKPPFPFSPGLEVAGEVMACGDGVSGLAAGDRVIAVTGWGGWAEQVVADAATVVPVPRGIDDVTAGGFAVAYGTSHLALTHRAHLEPGETLLVLGAAGGVGLTAVEIGKRLGATVIAAAGGSDKLKIAESYGADHLIDYRSEDLRERVKALTDGRGVDVVYDPVGGDAFDAALRCLAWEGRLVVIGFASGRISEARANTLLLRNIAVIGCPWGAYARHEPTRLTRSLAELLGWCQAGRLKPLISHRLPLSRAAEGLEMLMARQAIGKIVLSMVD